MYYVIHGNDPRRSVIAAYSSPQYPLHAGVPDDDPELTRYMNRSPIAQRLASIGVSTDDIVGLLRAAQEQGMFVDCDADGEIVAAFETQQRPGQEIVPR